MIALDPRSRFLAIFKALQMPFGYEVSCKLSQGRLLTDRCLVSFGRDDLCGDGAALSVVASILSDLAAPALCQNWLAEYLAGAGVIHFGFEAEGGAFVHKAYLEYVRDARLALETPGGPQAPVLVHRALKWRVGTDQVRETHYRLVPSGGLTLEDRLAQHDGDGARKAVVGMARGVLRQALTRTGDADLILLDVADVDSARHSFDLQLYDAGLRLADVEGEVMQLGRDLDIPADALSGFFEARSASVLGHIAGGQDATGQAFATLYFGAQEFGAQELGAQAL